MLVTTVEAEFRRELGEAVVDVHFDAIVFSTTLIGWLESAAIRRAIEGEEFVETIAETTHGAAGPIDSSIAESSLATVLLILAHDLFWDLDETIHNVAKGTAKLARGCVGGTGRCLDVGDG